MKSALKIISFTIIGLVMALALVPFVFKDKIIQFLKDDINKSLYAEVAFGDIDISVFKSFPDLRLSIDSLSISGVEDFEGIVLYKADRTSLDLNLSSLFGENITPKINAIKLDHPEINIIVLDSTRANYLISRDTSASEESKFVLQLKHYELNNAKITYQDNSMPIFLVLDSLDHSGSGDFTQDIFDLKTKSKAEKLFVKYDGTTYVNNVAIKLDAGIHINLLDKIFTLKDNVLKFNELDISGQGFVQMDDEDIITDFEFKTESEDFKSFLSIVPNAYTKDFAQVKTSGKASINGKISGIYSDIKQSLPTFDINIIIENGAFKYPSLPQDIKNLFANANIKTTRPDYKDMSANIPTFRLHIGNDAISGKLVANNLTGNQQVAGNLKGTLNLSNLAQAFPIPDMEVLKGMLQCDVTFDAKMSDVNAERYEAIAFNGSANGKDINIKMKDMPTIRLEQATATASPKMIAFDAKNMILGKSDLDVNAEIRNPLAFFSTEKQMKMDITAKSNYFDMDEWMTADDKQAPPSTELSAVPANEELIKNANINLNLQAKAVKMNGFDLKPLNLDASLSANVMEVRKFYTTVKGSDIKLNGTVVNAYDYLMHDGVLDGFLTLQSNKLDLNAFMTEAPANGSDEPLTVIPVPEKVRLKMQADVNELTYTNMILKDAKGILEVQNSELVLQDFNTKIMGGSFGLQGFYSTADMSKPVYSVKLDLNKIKYADAFKTFDMMRKVAPIAEYLDGFFNTSLVMKGNLGQNMMPILNTIDASGLIETLNGTIKGVDPLGKLSSLLGIKELSNIDLVNTRNWFEIANGFVEIKEFSKHIKGIDMTVGGKHGINQDMDYNVDLAIPREMLKGNKITGTVESGLSLIEKEASKIGINIDQGSHVYLNVKMTGNLKNPKFKITPKTGKGNSTGNTVKDKAQETVEELKDNLQKEIKNQTEILKDTITKKVNQEVDKVKTKIEETSQKAIDSLKNRVQKEVGTIIDPIAKGVIPDSLKQKAKDMIEKGGKNEIDKIQDKLKYFNPFKNKKKD